MTNPIEATTDRNGDVLVGQILDIIDRDNSRYKVAQAVAAFIRERDTAIEQRVRDELLFDLDEIDNKPWRVFRQLAKIMPEYEEEYRLYEAFYSFGGSHEVKNLIDKFVQTDDYKQSYFSQPNAQKGQDNE